MTTETVSSERHGSRPRRSSAAEGSVEPPHADDNEVEPASDLFGALHVQLIQQRPSDDESQVPAPRIRPTVEPPKRTRAAQLDASEGARTRKESTIEPGAAAPPTNEPADRISLLDPAEIEPEPFNGRGHAAFDPARNGDLIDSMAAHGNTVPIRVRPRANGPGFTCSSGSRRLATARHLAAKDPGFRISAIIDHDMSDADAYALCIADNKGRNTPTAMQRGRELRWALDNLYAGDRQACCAAHKLDNSQITRLLDLAALPPEVLACAADPEGLPPLFAEKVSPLLKKSLMRDRILKRALALDSRKLSAAKLQHYLLTGELEPPKSDKRVREFGDDQAKVKVVVTVASDQSATIKLPRTVDLNSEARSALAAFLAEQISALCGVGESVSSADEAAEI